MAAMLATVLVSFLRTLAVFDQTGLRTCLFPEELKVSLFQVVEKLIVFGRDRILRACTLRSGLLLRRGTLRE